MSSRLHSLDFARIAAAGMVWIYHCCYLDPVFHNAPWSVDPILLGIAKYGYLGVPLFFMISGFVIANSALGRSRSQFAAARFRRLFPAFSICLAATGVVLMFQGSTPPLQVFLANLTMIPRVFGQPYLDGVYWSLMFEIIFYTYVWLFLLGENFESRLRVFVVIWLLAAFLHTCFQLPGKVLFVLDWAPYFAVGCLCWIYRSSRRPLDAALLGLASIGASVTSALQTQQNPLVAGLIVATVAGLFPWMIGARVPRRFQSLAVAMGAVSYPLYLLHNEFGGWITRIVGSFALSFFIVALSSYLVVLLESRIRSNFRHVLKSA